MKSKRLIHKSVITLTSNALLVASCVILAYLAKSVFGQSPLRLTIENLPVFMAAFYFGPISAVSVAVCADVLSCIMAGMAPYPPITVGAALIGLISGLMFKHLLKKRGLVFKTVFSVVCAHTVGSMTVKTIALWFILEDAGISLLFRIPVYLIISAIESTLLVFLLKNKTLTHQINVLKGEK